MLICTVFTDKNGEFSKLIIQPEVTDAEGSEKIEIQLTPEQAEEIKILYAWVERADVGDKWENNALEITRTQ